MAIPPSYGGREIARTMPLPQAVDTSGPIAEGANAIGQAGQQYQALMREKQQLEQGAQFSVDLAQTQQDFEAWKVEQQQGGLAPGAGGYAKASADWLDQRQEQVFSSISDPHVKLAAMRQWAAVAGSEKAQAMAFESAAQINLAKQNQSAAGDGFANTAGLKAKQGDDPNLIPNTIALVDGSVGMLPMSPDARAAIAREQHQQALVSIAFGTGERDPSAMRALVETKPYLKMVDPKVRDALVREADGKIEQLKAAGRAQANHDREVLRDNLAATGIKLDAGAGTAADRAQLAQRYTEIGDMSKAAEWSGKARQFGTMQATRDYTLPQYDTRLAELSHKQMAGGLTPGEADEFKALQDGRTAQASRLDKPGGALLALQYAGVTLAPLDISSPATMQARAQQAAVAARKYGRVDVEPLLATELPAFQDMMHGGPTAKLKALIAIQGFGEQRAISGAARQMSGEGDGDFRIAATLSPQIARDVLRGADALKANPKAWDEKLVPAVLARYYGGILQTLPADYRADVAQASKQYYAARMSDLHHDGADAGIFADAIETVLGRNTSPSGIRRGGVAHTRSGIVLVPPSMTGDDLLARFARATPDQYRVASGGRAPVWPDGTAMTLGQFRALLPTALDSSHYGFRNRDGGLITDKHGQRYAVDVTMLPTR